MRETKLVYHKEAIILNNTFLSFYYIYTITIFFFQAVSKI